MLMNRKSLFATILALAALPLSAAITQPVQVEGGLVSGVPGSDQSIMTYKSIPFAAPPVGSLRWRAPQPVIPWKGLHATDKYPPSCIQEMPSSNPPWTYEFMPHNEIGEDCLYLNVFTPASASDKRPVFVYIYGGGFRQGGTAVPIYDGEGLAKKGLVVVTINYRVGLFGFLAHPELSSESGHQASGNYALLDQIAALKWIQHNIAHFGGDPGNVTIAGQSAGGAAVHDLTASPLARGLFQRAIVQSGGSTISRGGMGGLQSLAGAEKEGEKFAESKGAHSLAELRAISWQELLKPNADAQSNPRFAPIADGYVLPAPFMAVIAEGKQNDVVTLTGSALGELGGISGPQKPLTLSEFQARAHQRFGDAAEEFLKFYPATTDQEAQAAQKQSTVDQALVAQYLWARVRSKTAKTKVYEYLWDHTLPGPDSAKYGAFHSSDLLYTLNNLNTSDRPFTSEDQRIATMMSSYWANFITTGDPNGKGLPLWPAVDEKPQVMELGDKTALIPLADNPAKVQFFEKFLTAAK